MPGGKASYDVVILGGGSAGIVSGVMAGGLGMRVLLIEKERMGGECLNTGCVPSKALLHAARVAHTMRSAGSVGLTAASVSRHGAAGVMGHVRDTIAAVRAADATEELLRKYGVEITHGSASFCDAQSLALNDETITADNFVLATGSRPALPEIPGLGTDYYTNQTIFDIDVIPESLLVIGGGPVGVEMAQAFCRLGSRVVLVQRGPRLIPRDDSEAGAAIENVLRREGVDVRLAAEVQSVHGAGAVRLAVVRDRNGEREVPFAMALAAVGRLPNVEGLGLAAAGVTFTKQGVVVDNRLRTTAASIYACGDIHDGLRFSHMAEYEAKTVVRNIVFPGEARADYHAAPWATFTDPEVAQAGLTEQKARAQGKRIEVYRQPFAQNDRAITDCCEDGFVKVVTEGFAGRIVGTTIVGHSAGELIQEWALAMEHGMSVRAVADLIHVYPTLSMASQHAAQRWYEKKAGDPIIEKALDTYVQSIRPRQGAIAAGVAGLGLLGMGFGLARFLARRWRGRI